MRIYNVDSDKSLDDVTLYLTIDQAREMKNKLEGLIKQPAKSHSHISSDDFQKEITICIYDPNKLDHLSKRSKTLILEDK
jgi:hypothetical protein